MGTKPRRQFSAQFKLDAVLELLAGHTSAAQICRERHITDNLLYRWKQTFVEHAPSVFGATSASTSESETRIADMERLVGQLTLENEILKKAGTHSTLVRSRNGR